METAHSELVADQAYWNQADTAIGKDVKKK